MCGFITARKEVLDTYGVASLIKKQEHRGKDGYGAIAINEDGSSSHIKYMGIKPLIVWINALKGDPYIFIHHRATSVGGTKLALAHPLECEDTILMQNGTNKDPYHMVTESESDSDALATLANYMSPDNLENLILDKVGVVVFRKDGQFYLHRDKTRPLLQHTSGLMCSEPLIEGTWTMVEEGLDQFTFSEGKLVGVGMDGTVEVEDVGDVTLCSSCKKRHYVPEDFTVCHCCVATGEEQKKDSVRGNSYGGIPYADDYADVIESGWGWKNGVYVDLSEETYEAYKIPDNKEQVAVYELLPSDREEFHTYKKMDGIAVKADGKYYLVKSVNSGEEGTFIVKKVMMPKDKVRVFAGGHVPTNTTVIERCNLMEFAVYWNKLSRAYDMQDDVYFLEGDMLSEDDKTILMYDDYMKSYSIPVEYEYSAETYLNWC